MVFAVLFGRRGLLRLVRMARLDVFLNIRCGSLPIKLFMQSCSRLAGSQITHRTLMTMRN